VAQVLQQRIKPKRKPRKARGKDMQTMLSRGTPRNQNMQIMQTERRNDRKEMQFGKSPSVITGYRFKTMETLPQLLRKYFSALIDPEHHNSRFPDSQARPTCLFKSISEFDIPITMSASGAIGRFSVAVQPIMGDISNPLHYQLAVANVATDSWATTDWSKASSYLQTIGNRDPRVDPNSTFLTSTTNNGWIQQVIFNGAGAALAQPTAAAAGQNFTGQSDLVNQTTNTVDATLGSLNVTQNADGSYSLPMGQYTIDMKVTATSVGALTGVFPGVLPDISGNPQISTLVDTITRQSASPLALTLFNCSNTAFVTITAPSANVYFTINKTGTFLAAGDLSTLQTTVIVSPVNIPSVAPPQTGGAIQLIRPIAQALLVSYVGPSLLDGGRIASAYLPAKTLVNQYFARAGQQGNLQFLENVADIPGAYSGPLKTGTYVWWSPYSTADSQFAPVSAWNGMTSNMGPDSPSMVVSGMFNSGQAITVGNNDVLKARLVTIFEFQSISSAFDQEVCAGATSIIDDVNRLLSSQPHALPNGKHVSWISSLLGGIGTIIKQNPTLLPTLIGAGAMML